MIFSFYKLLVSVCIFIVHCTISIYECIDSGSLTNENAMLLISIDNPASCIVIYLLSDLADMRLRPVQFLEHAQLAATGCASCAGQQTLSHGYSCPSR